MRVVIAGGHGQVARHLSRQLATRGDEPVGLVRAEDQRDDLVADGAEPVVLDLESCEVDDLVEVVAGADAVVFAAGAGPGSGPERKWSVDHGAAAKLTAAAQAAGVDRYVMLSSMGADDPPADDDVFSVYLRAKAKADAELTVSGLAWTIVRPGRLTDEPGTGRVTAGVHVARGAVPREDVAAVLLTCLDDDGTCGAVIELVGGEQPIAQAVAAAAAASVAAP